MSSAFWVDEIHLAAKNVLSSFRQRFPQYITTRCVPIIDIADLICEMRIVLTDLDRNTSGLYRLETGIVEVNKLESTQRQRFTIAHEVGHHVLHRADAGPRKVIRDTRRRIREDLPEESAQASQFPGTLHSRKEAEANIFASELLMPSAEVVHLFYSGLRNVDSLAREFDVSPLAMQIKLTNLRLITGTSPYRVLGFESRAQQS